MEPGKVLIQREVTMQFPGGRAKILIWQHTSPQMTLNNMTRSRQHLKSSDPLQVVHSTESVTDMRSSLGVSALCRHAAAMFAAQAGFEVELSATQHRPSNSCYIRC